MNAPDQLPDVDVPAGERAAVLAALRIALGPVDPHKPRPRRAGITATAYIGGRPVPARLGADGIWQLDGDGDTEVIDGAD